MNPSVYVCRLFVRIGKMSDSVVADGLIECCPDEWQTVVNEHPLSFVTVESCKKHRFPVYATIRKLLPIPCLRILHVPLYLVVGDFGVNLGRRDMLCLDPLRYR